LTRRGAAYFSGLLADFAHAQGQAAALFVVRHALATAAMVLTVRVGAGAVVGVAANSFLFHLNFPPFV
jgi:hypothetical protein